MQIVKGFYVLLVLGILKEVTRSSLIQKRDSDEEGTVLFNTVQNMFQKMLEHIAQRFKKHPKEGLGSFIVSRPIS